MSGKWILDTGSMQENFFAESVLIGIASSLPFHRFCWTLNNYFDINFVREPDLDICVQFEAGKQTFFSIYQFYLPLSSGRYLIYKLKNGEDVLLNDVRQLDYLWLLQSNNAENDAKNIIQQLRAIPEIQLAQILDSEKLKNLDNLLI